MTKNTPRLLRTKNYDLFLPHPYNRDIAATDHLEKSMLEHGFDGGLPIRCVKDGDKLRITHGHHRFHVARKLGIYLWYIIAPNDIPLFDSEASNRSWNIKDFTTARARAGEPAAGEVLRAHRETGIAVGTCISLLGGENGGSHNKTNAMRMGKYQLGDHSVADVVFDTVLFLKGIGIKFASAKQFVAALSKAVFVDQFDAQDFMRKAKTHKALMEPRRNIDDYLDLIETVYNYGKQSKNQIPLVFLVKQAMNARNPALRGKG